MFNSQMQAIISTVKQSVFNLLCDDHQDTDLSPRISLIGYTWHVISVISSAG